jgi:hypothetical protein
MVDAWAGGSFVVGGARSPGQGTVGGDRVEINPVVRGWMQYYGAFYQTALYPLLRRINYYVKRWVRKKYRKVRTFNKFQKRWCDDIRTGIRIARRPRCPPVPFPAPHVA